MGQEQPHQPRREKTAPVRERGGGGGGRDASATPSTTSAAPTPQLKCPGIFLSGNQGSRGICVTYTLHRRPFGEESEAREALPQVVQVLRQRLLAIGVRVPRQARRHLYELVIRGRHYTLDQLLQSHRARVPRQALHDRPGRVRHRRDAVPVSE